MTNIDLTPEAHRLRNELNELRQEYSKLYTQKDTLLTYEQETLYIEYLNNVGKFEYENFALQTDLSALKLKVQLAQAAVNRDEKPDLSHIEETVKAQMSAYYEQIQKQAKAIEAAKTATYINPEKTKEMKDLYRLLVKKLHPDLNPEQDESLNDLFLQVQTAYRTMNLDLLRDIVTRMELNSTSKDGFTLTETTQTYIDSLKKRIEELKDEISKIEESFPFNFRSHLEDQEWIISQQKRLLQQKEDLLKEIEIYKDRFSLLTE